MSVDQELAANAVAEEEVRFGRNRLLKLVGSGLVGFTAQSILRKDTAWANHTLPGPCYGPADWERCPCCSGSTCTCSTCGYYHHEGCPTGGQCWTQCYSNCVWRCCDWMYTSGGTWKHCICGTCISGRTC